MTFIDHIHDVFLGHIVIFFADIDAHRLQGDIGELIHQPRERKQKFRHKLHQWKHLITEPDRTFRSDALRDHDPQSREQKCDSHKSRDI